MKHFLWEYVVTGGINEAIASSFYKDGVFLFNRKDLVTLTRGSPFLLNKKYAPQDAQLAEGKIIAMQFRSRAEIAQTRNLFIYKNWIYKFSIVIFQKGKEQCTTKYQPT